ncbi:MAG TPA: peptidoglycan DD-metalloendopeptidase family protein [Deinococcales bacterium]|nr:peptidoglycan DD-metalloendopeptidase family protein [Deinococcales bacterium]
MLFGTPALAAVAGFTLKAASLPVLRPQTTLVLEPMRPQPVKAVAWVTVRPGDTVGRFASRYGVSSRDIRIQNGMMNDDLEVGRELRIPYWARSQRDPHLPPGVRLHEVRPGEVLSTITARYGVSTLDLISANVGIPSLDRLSAGMELLIPGSERGVIVRIKPGQTMLSVASYYSVPLNDMARANGISDPRRLREGDYVLVPGLKATRTMAVLENRRAAEIAAREKARAEAEARRQAEVAKARAEAEARRQAELAAAERQREARLAVARRASNTPRQAVASSYYRAPSAGGGYAWPMRSYTISSSYGRRGLWIGRSNFHTGIDLAAPTGTPIYAAREGTVIESGWGDFGLGVFVGLGDGVVNIYGHMSRTAVYPGQRVDRGQLLGYVGCTGICTGPHLHFEVRVNGVPQNPYNFLD